MNGAIRLAVPDVVSSSYFPALAATRLSRWDTGRSASGTSGPVVTLEHIFPASRAMEALREGAVDFVAAAAHAVFGQWHGARILMALSQRTYWMLTARTGIAVVNGTPDGLRDMHIAAAPGPDLALRCLLGDWGIDLAERSIAIEPLPQSYHPGQSFGVRAAHALSEGLIDAFWANSMAAAIAVSMGAGSVVLDPRRGGGPPEASAYTFPALLTSERVLTQRPGDVRATVRTVINAQQLLATHPELARRVVDGLFPAREADLIVDLIRRDAPYYSPEVNAGSISGLIRFARTMGLSTDASGLAGVVASEAPDMWSH